jgi:hypothetical protein
MTHSKNAAHEPQEHSTYTKIKDIITHSKNAAHENCKNVACIPKYNQTSRSTVKMQHTNCKNVACILKYNKTSQSTNKIATINNNNNNNNNDNIRYIITNIKKEK